MTYVPGSTVDRLRSGVREITDNFGLTNPGALAAVAGAVKFTEQGLKQWGATDGSTWLMTAQGDAYWNTGAGPLGEGGLVTVDAGFANADIEMQTNGNTTNGTRMGICFRRVDDLNFWSFFAYRSSGGTAYWFLRKAVAGVTTDLGGSPGTTAATNGQSKLRVVLEGSKITPYYNDIAVMGTVTDGAHVNATRHGFQCDSSSGLQYFTARRR